MIASIITALYLLNIIPAQSAYTFLYVCGLLLIAAEVVVTSYGLITLNALMAFAVGYAIQTGNNQLFGIELDWSVLFGLAFTEAFILGVVGVTIIRYRKLKATTGKETMIGKRAQIIRWDGQKGTALIEGETWKAISEAPMELDKDDEVTVQAVEGLTLKIIP